MGSEIRVRLWHEDGSRNVLEGVIDEALAVFATVEAACTRFDLSSPLMRANATPAQAHRLPRECFDALREAAWFHRSTEGLFDPRVLRDLVALGYDRSLPFASMDVNLERGPAPARPAMAEWKPRFDDERSEVVLGEVPVDLGGIGKGLAVRWASAVLRAAGGGHLVEAGGDCYCAGSAPDGGPWRIAVEDAFNDPRPRAVLELQDLACATSSTRLRRWHVDGRAVHHLIDPRSGCPGGQGLRAVTVVCPDPAEAEVWAKALFLTGAGDIESVASARSLAALWIGEAGQLSLTEPMARLVSWGPS